MRNNILADTKETIVVEPEVNFSALDIISQEEEAQELQDLKLSIENMYFNIDTAITTIKSLETQIALEENMLSKDVIDEAFVKLSLESLYTAQSSVGLSPEVISLEAGTELSTILKDAKGEKKNLITIIVDKIKEIFLAIVNQIKKFILKVQTAVNIKKPILNAIINRLKKYPHIIIDVVQISNAKIINDQFGLLFLILNTNNVPVDIFEGIVKLYTDVKPFKISDVSDNLEVIINDLSEILQSRSIFFGNEYLKTLTPQLRNTENYDKLRKVAIASGLLNVTGRNLNVIFLVLKDLETNEYRSRADVAASKNGIKTYLDIEVITVGYQIGSFRKAPIAYSVTELIRLARSAVRMSESSKNVGDVFGEDFKNIEKLIKSIDEYKTDVTNSISDITKVRINTITAMSKKMPKIDFTYMQGYLDYITSITKVTGYFATFAKI